METMTQGKTGMTYRSSDRETKPQPPWERAAMEGHAAIGVALRNASDELERAIGWAGTLGEDTERLEAVKLTLEVLLRERQ